MVAGTANLNHLLARTCSVGLSFSPPTPAHRVLPTHFPRDDERAGRQIDAVLGRMVSMGEVVINSEARHKIGTDHAALQCSLLLRRHARRWPMDSRARYVQHDLPDDPLVDAGDIEHLARHYTAPRPGKKYRDPPEVQQAIQTARRSGDKATWKQVHKLRRQARRQWESERLAGILQGDWCAYRARKLEKEKKSGWWGRMLEDKSEEDVTADVHKHLSSKMCGPDPATWDAELDTFISEVGVSHESSWQPYSLDDLLWELGKMKKRSSVGCDAVGVDLLHQLAQHPMLADDFLQIVNHVICHNAPPDNWRKSILALLAKKETPSGPGDLRPIAMSSALQKLTSRLVMSRIFPCLRTATDIACCGKNRQAADMLGCMSRLRDMVKEWKIPLLVAKLDIRGAFDALSCSSVASYLVDKLANAGFPRETRYMLEQLRSNVLRVVCREVTFSVSTVARVYVKERPNLPSFSLLSLRQPLTRCEATTSG